MLHTGEAALLETLRERIGYTYLSDLRRRGRTAQVCDVIAALDAASFPIAEWNDAVIYLTGKRVVFQSAEDARQFFTEKRN